MKMMNRVSLLCALVLSAAAAVGADSPPNDAFNKAVSALPAEQQIGAVIAKLKELNPNFDGKETHKIEGGAVTELAFSSVGVTDISPVKALTWLKKLTVAPWAANQKGSLADLSALKGMKLTWLWCHNNPISDLSPLKDMPLTVLSCGGTQAGDLSPLVGMQLSVLSFNDTTVKDIGPLEGMPLTVVWCNNTQVADLSPLKNTPLREIKCNFVAERDAAVLRGIRTLAKINDMTAAAFWARVGPMASGSAGILPGAGRAPTAQQPAGKMPALPAQSTSGTPQTGSVSAKEQIRRFVEKMKELNPKWDGLVDFKADGSKVVELRFSAEGIGDISPVSTFRSLRNLECSAINGKITTLSDLSPLKGLPLETLECQGWLNLSDLTPLKGMKLTKFICNWSKITDLSPLQGMPVSSIDLHNSNVSDISPVREMKKLRSLNIAGCKVQDLKPLKGMPLTTLACDFVPERDAKLLRSITSLQKINYIPADEFWKHVKAGDVPQAK